MKTIKYIERPYIIHTGRIHCIIPELIEIYNGKVIYHFKMDDKTKLMLHSHNVYATEKDARKHL